MRDLELTWVARTPAHVGRERAAEAATSRATTVKIRPARRQAGRYTDPALPARNVRTLRSSAASPDPQEIARQGTGQASSFGRFRRARRARTGTQAVTRAAARSITCRAGSKPVSGGSSGRPSSAASGHESDDLGGQPAARRAPPPARPPARSPARAARRSGRGRWWTPASARSPRSIPMRAHPGQPAAGLAEALGDLAGRLDPGALQLDVEGGQRRAGGDQRRAGAGVQLRGAEIGPSSPEPRRRRSSTSPPVRKKARSRREDVRGELSVEEHRHLRLGGDPAGGGQRLGPRGLAVFGAKPDHRAHVERPDAGVRALVPAHVDRLGAGPGPVDERARERVGRPAERQHGAVVDRVRMRVQQRGAGRERGRDRVDSTRGRDPRRSSAPRAARPDSAQTTRAPSRTTGSPSTVTSGFRTRQSR